MESIEAHRLSAPARGHSDDAAGPLIEILVNPTARGAAALADALEAGLSKRGYAARRIESAHKRRALPWAADGATVNDAEPPDGLVCLTGDGTLDKLAAGAIRDGVPLAPLPFGFGNLFARAFGPPAGEAGIEAVIDRLVRGERISVDVGRREQQTGNREQLFLSVSAYGFLEEARILAERGARPRGRLARRLGYLAAALRCLFAGPPTPLSVALDGAPLCESAVVVLVANVPAYPGRLALAPDADPRDGLVDVSAIPAASRPRLVLALLTLWLTRGRCGALLRARGREVVVSGTPDPRRCLPSGRFEPRFARPWADRLTVLPGALTVLAPPEPPLRLAYLCTTFPLLSETFLQREVRALAALPPASRPALEVHSLWRGAREFEGLRVARFCLLDAARLPFELLYWLVRRPRRLARLAAELARALVSRRPPSAINAGETVIGLAYGLAAARRLARSCDLLHAAWATAPGSAALVISRLAGRPYVLSAQAYDVFRDGGDWLLGPKMRHAAIVVTSSESTRNHLISLGNSPNRVRLVRRGLATPLPPCQSPRVSRIPLRILWVGRLIEKKGPADLLAICKFFKNSHLSYRLRIVGAGPLSSKLLRIARESGLESHVEFLGALSQDSLAAHYAWADVLVYTGKIASNGDRDGLPNVIPEALCRGIPVVANPVAGVPEAVTHEKTGLLVREPGLEPWLAALSRLQGDDGLYRTLAAGGRAWVEENYDVEKNAAALMRCLDKAAGYDRNRGQSCASSSSRTTSAPAERNARASI